MKEREKILVTVRQFLEKVKRESFSPKRFVDREERE
jgi:hypothetical protein